MNQKTVVSYRPPGVSFVCQMRVHCPAMAPRSAAPSTGCQKGRAAVYLRVSTEHQKYSLRRQAAELNEYAAEHGLKIVNRYVDQGRSGRTLQARPALIEMLQMIVQGRASFSEVLVYDVSRWGTLRRSG